MRSMTGRFGAVEDVSPYHLWRTVLSAAVLKMSRRLGPHDATAGDPNGASPRATLT